MKLVANARSAWRWLSVQGLAMLAILPLVWETLPPDLKAFIPQEWRPWILTIIAVASILGRLIDQGRKGDD